MTITYNNTCKKGPQPAYTVKTFKKWHQTAILTVNQKIIEAWANDS